MNQQCKVCGEPAAGFHFGAFTCEGCKSFFGRTYNNLGSISECKNNGECVINKKNRTACKACRLRKCLLVGMSKSGSRYGRRSNWFKIHCLLQEQQQQQAAGGGMLGMNAMSGLLRPHPYLPLFRAAPPVATDAKSSESDSGASSADPDDDLRSASALRTDFYHHYTQSLPSHHKLPSPASDSECFARRKLSASITLALPASPASLPSVSPTGTRWLAPAPLGLADPSAWRELWLRAPPAPGQEQPIDLSIRAAASAQTPPPSASSDASEPELSIDVGVEDGCKPVPLDLSLETKRIPDFQLTG